MTLDKLIKIIGQDVSRRKPRKWDDAFLRNVSTLWREFFAAKKHVVRRFASDTTKAEQILRMAKHRGILSICVERGMLPTHADLLKVDDGAAFRGHYATLEEKTSKRPLLILGGAYEMDRRRH